MTKVSQTDKARFEALTGNADGFATIGQLVDLCDEGGYWTPEFLSASSTRAKKAHIRRLIKSLKDEEGWPVWASIETTNEEGRTVRVYKQELLFDIEDYRKVVTYHARVMSHHKRMGQGYAKRCKKRFNVQLRFGFDEDRLPKKPR